MLYISRNAMESAPSTTRSQKVSAWRCRLTGPLFGVQRPAPTSSSSPRAVSGSRRGGGQFGHLRPVVQAGLEDGTHDRDVELAAPEDQPGERVEPGVAPVVAHRRCVRPAGRPTSPASVRRFSASRTAGRDTPSTSASRRSLGSAFAGLHLAAEHLGDDLVEHVLGHGSPVHRLQGHAPKTASGPVRGQVV